jgi:hypothetical protein
MYEQYLFLYLSKFLINDLIKIVDNYIYYFADINILSHFEHPFGYIGSEKKYNIKNISKQLINENVDINKLQNFNDNIDEIYYYKIGSAEYEQDWKLSGKLKNNYFFYYIATCSMSDFKCQCGNMKLYGSIDFENLINFAFDDVTRNNFYRFRSSYFPNYNIDIIIYENEKKENKGNEENEENEENKENEENEENEENKENEENEENNGSYVNNDGNDKENEENYLNCIDYDLNYNHQYEGDDINELQFYEKFYKHEYISDILHDVDFFFKFRINLKLLEKFIKPFEFLRNYCISSFQENISQIFYINSKFEKEWHLVGKFKDGIYFYYLAICCYHGFNCMGNMIVYTNSNLDNLINNKMEIDQTESYRLFQKLKRIKQKMKDK